MAKHPTPTPAAVVSTFDESTTLESLNQLAVIETAAHNNATALAVQLGYDGTLTVGALEDEIRFYQRRTVEALLETGKRLILLKALTPHGEFEGQVQSLGFSSRTAQRFMQAAMKTNKSANLALLANGIKKASDFLELITHDDDVIENLAEMDGFDRMSASQLRAKARELKAENEATQKVLDKKNAELDKQARHIAKTTPDQKLLELQKEATALMNDALGCIRGNLRQAFIQIKNHDDNDHTLFMAGLLGQVQVDLAALRHEFNLPDLSTAADAQLAAEVAQWAGA